MRRTVSLAVTLIAAAAVALAPGSGASAPSFHDWVRAGSGITEPGIHIAPDGTIFVDGPSGVPVHSKLFRSTDDGQTFSEVAFGTGFNRLPGGGDSDVEIRTTPSGQRIYFLDLWAGSNSITISEDNGATWTTGTPFTTLPLSDRQWIALGRVNELTGMDTVYALYALIQTPNQVMIARSRTGGLTWETHVPAPAALNAYGFTGPLVSDGDRFIAFVWEDGGWLRAAYSEDEGETWGQSEVIARGVGGLIPVVALDGDDMYATWVHRDDWSIKVARSTDRGRSWSEPVTVSGGGSNVFPWIDARDGKVAVAWYAADTHTGRPDAAPAETVWVARYLESIDRGETWSTTVDVGPGKTGIICISGLSCSLDGGGRELGDFMSVAIGYDGKSVVGFGGRVGSGVKVAVQR